MGGKTAIVTGPHGMCPKGGTVAVLGRDGELRGGTGFTERVTFEQRCEERTLARQAKPCILGREGPLFKFLKIALLVLGAAGSLS